MRHETNTNNLNQLRLFDSSQYISHHYICPNVIEIHFGQADHDPFADGLHMGVIIDFPPAVEPEVA